MTGDALQWTSDLVGSLGSGSLLQTSALIAGFHTITLTATDSAGQSTSAHTIVRVGVEAVYLAGAHAVEEVKTYCRGRTACADAAKNSRRSRLRIC